MPDNVTEPLTGSGDSTAVIATELIASSHHQTVVMEQGEHGAVTRVSSTNPLPITSTAEGAIADAAYVSGSGSIISVLKGIFGLLTGGTQKTQLVSSGGNIASVSASGNLGAILATADNVAGRVKVTDGTNVVAVKAASTPPAATDTALVTTDREALDLSATQTVALVNDAATLTLRGHSTLNWDVAGTFSATLVVEVTTDGTTWFAIPRGLPTNGVGGVLPSGASITTVSNGYVSVAGYVGARIRCSIYTSGSPVITLHASRAVRMVSLDQAIPPGTNNIGTVVVGSNNALMGGVNLIDTGGTTKASVKAASTSAVATDTSLVVQINPQQTPTVSTATGSLGTNNGGATGTVAAFSATTNTTILAANTGAKTRTFMNDTDQDLLITLGAAATTTSAYSVRVKANGGFFVTDYRGAITGLMVTTVSTGVCNVTECV